ncbi:sulfatase family protein [Stakelama saccharophila]|uniref:Sulfatase-like hydrolase/transferase n=1 Tax=Stakelama saccharophila TaxID=3075605 RepID=A0ABZ0B598_9SPHN|nr:sulfatase-like hydrolase/transferase [Stakelama sp. W311]WNO52427.1 sulfatase-like hydrolase/transferase [Stakelama sp. W311]
MTERRPPNIVFVMTDQQRFDTIAAAGFDYMDTPNLDRMAREGVLFSHMYVTSPSCAPSRASLFTGLYPHTNGVFRNDENWTHSWVGRMAEAGYHCVNIGKMHTSAFEDSFGFHERHVVENKDRDTPRLPFYLDNWDKALWTRGYEKPSRVTYRRRADYRERLGAFIWELPADLHPDNFVPQMACMWLDRYPTDEPFFLQIGIPGPHPPYDPTQDYVDRYAGRDLPMPIRDRAAMAAEPEALRALREQHLKVDHDAVVHLADPGEAQLRRQREHYFANVSMIDTQMGNLIEALERRGVLDDTIVIFTSDHGDCLGDHGHSQKWTMYEQSVRVPAIVWAPGRIEGGRTVGDLVSLFDFAPTILDLGGVTPPRWMEARSLAPYLAGDAVEPRSHIFAEHAGDRILSGTEFMTMVRDERWKLVHFVDSDEGQLFDLESDPHEIHDRWNDPECGTIRQRLKDAILAWRIRSSVTTQGWTEALDRGTGRTPASNRGRRRDG